MNLKNIEKNSIMKLGSIILGIIIWVLVIYTENSNFETNINGIDIQISGENTLISNNLVVINKEEIKDGAVKIRGKRSDIIESMGNVSANIDVSSITSPGTYDAKINYSVNSGALYITKRKKPTVSVEVERTKLKEFDVEIIQNDEFADEKIIVESVSELDKVSIEGAKTDIEKIKHAVLFVDVENMTEDNVSEYQVVFTDEQFKEVEFENKVYKHDEYVKVTNKIYQKAVLPVEIEFNEDKNKYVIETEWISEKNVIVGLGEGTDVKSLKVKIDEKLGSEAKEYTAKLQDLTGIYMPDAQDVKVKARALPIVSREVTVPVEVIFDDNQKYIVDEKIKLKAKGAEEYINEKNIKAKVNIKGLTPGVHNVKVEIVTEKDGLTVSEKNIRVEIH